MKPEPKTKKEYIETRYYELYADGSVDLETEETGKFLAENVKGKALDAGCGPVPQIWAICMPNATEIYAFDLVPESIDFINEKLRTKNDWSKNFGKYQKIAEGVVGSLPENYILSQIDKLKSVQQADMTKDLPFEDNYFDTVMSLFSLGVLRNDAELSGAIKNMARVLKSGGKLLHINTNGQNSNDVLPEYTWKGLSQMPDILTPHLKQNGFKDTKIKEIDVSSGNHFYKHDKLFLLSAVKH